MQVFSGEFCEVFKDTFFHRIPPVAASGIVALKCELKLLEYNRILASVVRLRMNLAVVFLKNWH